MNKPIRQHTVPKVYLKHFCDEQGKLQVYKIKDDKFLINQNPTNTTINKNFYTIEVDGKPDFTIEEIMSKYIENDYSEVVQKITDYRQLSKHEEEYLALFAAFQFSRTTKSRQQFNAMIAEMNEKLLQIIIPMEKHHNPSKYTQEEWERMDSLLKALEEKNIQLEVPKEMHLQHMMEFSLEASSILRKLDWIFLEAPKGSSFITSDNPFVIHRPTYLERWQGLGLLTPGARKTFPLTSKLCLVMCDLGNKRVFEKAQPKLVRGININTAVGAHHYLISGVKPLLERVVKQIRQNLS